MSAHSDWINTLEAAHDKRFMYSGCRDGVVKVWKMTKGNRELKCTAQLSLNSIVSQPIGGSGSINTISKIDKQFGEMFATGGSDKQIRIWKYTENSNVHEDGRQSNFDQYLVEGGDGQPDYEMIDGDINHDEDDFFEFDDNNAVPRSVEKMRP
jgi:WD40 repeat protein